VSVETAGNTSVATLKLDGNIREIEGGFCSNLVDQRNHRDLAPIGNDCLVLHAIDNGGVKC